MPKTPIDVAQYKDMYATLASICVAIDGEGDMGLPGRYNDLPYPDWICDHCGFDNGGEFENNPCPRCNNNHPIVH